MCVFYDFCRRVDDIVDDSGWRDGRKTAELERWRANLRACYEGGDLGPLEEMQPLLQRYEVPLEEPMAIIDGVAMDIGNPRYETIDDLLRYCWHVASAVGLVSIRIFGCDVSATRAFAIHLGYALQLTNILRDVVDDYRTMGRVYLPQMELRTFGVAEQDLADPSEHAGARALFRMCHYRCQHYFAKARRLMPAAERQRVGSALVMAAFYEDFLRVFARRGFRLGTRRLKLSKARKVWLLLRTFRELDRPAEPMAPPNQVCVWGAGAAGLAAALEAGRRGHTPIVLEGAAQAGGRAQSYPDRHSGQWVDNGQHILMGCYEAFLGLLDLLGTTDQLDKADRLAVPYRSAGGESHLAALELPAPWHLLGALVAFRELRWRDRAAILCFGLRLRLGERPQPAETAGSWLRRWRQTPGALRALWEPFCLAALNEPLMTADAGLLHETLRRSLFGKKAAAAIYLAKGGFGELLHPRAGQYLASIGGELRLRTRITGVETDAVERVTAVQTSQGERIASGWHISALPWTRLRALLPAGIQRARLERLAPAPLISARVRFERALAPIPTGFVGLLDSPLHWVFAKEVNATGATYAVVISAAGSLSEVTWPELRMLIESELRRVFGGDGCPRMLACEVHRWREATFAASPSSEACRLGPLEAPWPNVVLAGDWTSTGLPATLEGAAHSGFVSAQCLDAVSALFPHLLRLPGLG